MVKPIVHYVNLNDMIVKLHYKHDNMYHNFVNYALKIHVISLHLTQRSLVNGLEVKFC